MYQPSVQCNPYEMFKDFYSNPFIQSIKNNKKWTISTKQMKDNGKIKKMPLDIYRMIYDNELTGAKFANEQCLTDLDTICQYVPDAANNTYWLDALIDGFVVLDIEPSCPKHIKDKLLQLNYVYGEVSVSGKGIHLVFPLPACITEYPIAAKKVTLQEEHNFYEILMNHYITFTRNSIGPATGNGDFTEVFRELCAIQKEVIATDVDVSELEPEDIPLKDEIVTLLSRSKYKKTPSDFKKDNYPTEDDPSKYEFAYIGFLHYKLKCLIKSYGIRKIGHTYTDNEKAWILYEVAKDKLTFRQKHTEKRCGLPWLLWIAKNVISKDRGNPNNQKTENDEE